MEAFVGPRDALASISLSPTKTIQIGLVSLVHQARPFPGSLRHSLLRALLAPRGLSV